MNELKAYIQSIEPQLLNHISGKMGELVKLVKDKKPISEDVLIHHFCGSAHPRKYYHNLKSRTLKILQALAIVSHAKGASEVKKKLDNCRKNFTIGQKFLGKGEKNEGVRLIRLAHRTAVEYDFVHMACELSATLHHHHVYYQPHKKKAAAYAAQVTHYADAYRNEKKIEQWFYHVIAHLSGPVSHKELQHAVENIAPIKALSLKSRTYQSMVKVIYLMQVGNYAHVIENCAEMLRYYQGQKGAYHSHVLFFLTHKGLAHVAGEQYGKAAKTFITAKEYTSC